MAKFSRACLGALLMACVALPVFSAAQQQVPAKEATAKAAVPAKDDAQQKRIEDLGAALQRIQNQGKPAAPTTAVAAPKMQPEQLVSVQVSDELGANPTFKELVKDMPHALVSNDQPGVGGSALLATQGDLDQLRKDVDSRREHSSNRRLDELAKSLRAVQATKIDLSAGRVTYDAAQADPATGVTTPEMVDAQAAGTAVPAPAAAPAENATPGVFGAAPPGNPETPPTPAGEPAAPAAPAAAPAAPAADAGATPAPADVGATPPAPVPAAPAEGTDPSAPGKRDEAPGAASAESNAEISTKIRELEDKGSTAIAESGVTSAKGKGASKTTVEAPAPKAYQGDPLEQRVNLDFREMELSNVVALLASKAGINVIAGTDLSGTVTANLRNVPLRQAIETSLRMNGLGMLEEEGIYRIVPYEESVASKRVNQVLNLKNAKAEEVRKVLEDVIKGSPDERRISVSANPSANLLVIAGPENRVPELVAMANQLDIAKPVLPTLTEAIKLNYAEPKDVLPTITAMLSKEIGKVAVDDRSRNVIVTDLPVNVENIRAMVEGLDTPTKTVSIEAMIVDVTLTDDAETGVDWVVNLLRSQSLREAAKGENGRFVSDVQKLSFDTNIPSAAEAGSLTFGMLTGNIDWTGIIKAEIKNFNGKLMSSPSILTVENKPATITIAEEIPYIELIQTAAGGQQNKTSFKEIGTLLEVTPRVTHDDHIISMVNVKESNTSGTFNNVPIENKRELSTSLRMANGQTVFMGGLRKNDDGMNVRKVPVLGDIPVVNFLFRNNKKTDRKNELVVFLTCNVVKDAAELTPHQQDRLDDAGDPKLDVNGGNELFEYTVHPGELRDPVWKYRRTSN